MTLWGSSQMTLARLISVAWFFRKALLILQLANKIFNMLAKKPCELLGIWNC